MVSKHINSEKMRSYWLIYFAFIAYLVIIVTLSGCSSSTIGDESLKQTSSALENTVAAQATILLSTNQAQAATQAAQSTLLAQQATQAAQQPSPTTSTNTPMSPAEMQVTPAPNVQAVIKSANILLFENISSRRIFGSYHPRYVQEALNEAGYSFTDVGSAQGWFKTQLQSDTKWDLIIASSEAAPDLEGEYFELLLKQIEKGTAVIIEIYYLDDIAGGKIAPLLEECGVALYKDWGRASNLVLYPLITDHPVLNYPNQGISMTNVSIFWEDDHGDLLKLTGSGDAQLLLSSQEKQTNDHGTLASCFEGRVLIQTFRSHDFGQLDVVPLWENYIYYVLKNKFLKSP